MDERPSPPPPSVSRPHSVSSCGEVGMSKLLQKCIPRVWIALLQALYQAANLRGKRQLEPARTQREQGGAAKLRVPPSPFTTKQFKASTGSIIQ